MARLAVEHKFTGTTGPIDSLSTPVVAVTNVGTTGATTYGYRVSAINSVGETLASSTVTTSTGNASLTTSNFNRISWSRISGATGYKVYGRTSGSELLLSTVTDIHYDDVGTATPAGALPSSNTTGYSSARTSIGSLMKQQSGPNGTDDWIGPYPTSIARPMEFSTGIPAVFPHVIRWSDTIDWVFFADNATATTSRRVMLGIYNRATNTFALEGFVTVTHPSGTNATVRGFRMDYETYTTGTITAAGTAITGVGTSWTTDKICAGSRIGFGSTDPSQITRWYEVSAVLGNTSINTTVAVDATISVETPYVIEELRCAMLQTNSVATSGGLFLVKGLRQELFTTAGTTIAAATTTDLQRACYWLADASTVTNTAGLGCSIQEATSSTSRKIYCLDGTTSTKVYVYNIRAGLTGLSAGKSTTAFSLVTGAQTVTGTSSQANNGRIGTLNHGPGAGEECLYWTTTTRIYRAKLNNIVSGSTVWISDCMVEIPPGSANTYGATAGLNAVEIADSIDRLIVTSSGAAGVRHYITQYQTNVSQFDLIWGVDIKQIDQTLADPMTPIAPTNVLATPFSLWSEGGLTYLARIGTAATNSHIYVTPFGAHWGYQNVSTGSQRVITPAISTPNASSYAKACYRHISKLGSDRYAISPEPINMFYRTNGIDDNTGKWSQLDDDGDLSGVSPASEIQFMFEFKTIGTHSIPGRLVSVEMIYNTQDTLPSHLQWNFSDSDNADGTVGFIQKTLYGSVPNLQIDYYRSDTDINLLTQQSTSTTYGAFQYWTGAAWANGLGSDTVGQRRRFVPTSGLPSSTNVYAKIKVI